MGLRAQGAGEHDHRQQWQVAAAHRPDREQEHEPPEQRQVRHPCLGHDRRPVGTDEDGQRGSRAEDEREPPTAMRNPQDRRHRDDLDRRRGGLHRPGAASEESVDRPHGIEAEGPQVAPLVPDGPDAGREDADQRRVAAADVAQPQLGLGLIADRVPSGLVEDPEGHDQRQHQEHQEPERSRRGPVRMDRESAHSRCRRVSDPW